MGRGEAKRRRIERALRAAAEKNASNSLNTGFTKTKDKKSRVSEDQEKLPASLRRMLELKAAAAGEGPGKRKHINLNTATNKTAAEAKFSEGKREKQMTHEQSEAKTNAAANRSTVRPSDNHKSLADRKKTFLKQKKLRKKGKSAGNKADGEHLLYTNESKVNFGTVAHQPLRANLKRKHWSETEAANNHESWRSAKKLREASGRLNSVGNGGNLKFTKDVVDEYRSRRNSPNNGATMQSLKELVRQGANA